MNEYNDRNDSVGHMAPSESGGDIRLLVLDLDGTIADESNRIRDSVVKAVNSAQHCGVGVAIATGRRYQSSLFAYNTIGSTLPLICYEGALIREPKTGFVHSHWPLGPRVAAQVLDHTEPLSLNGRVSVQFHIEDDIYVSNLNSAAVNYFAGSQIEPIVAGDLRQLLDRAITKVMVLSDDVEVVDKLSRQLKYSHSRIQVIQGNSVSSLEAFHPTVNKRSAVSYLTERIVGLRPKNVMAVGDGFADIGMLRYAGIGVAMGNAPVAVKEFADWITSTIEEDGVANAIERWILSARSGRRPLPLTVDLQPRRSHTRAPKGCRSSET